MHGAGERCVERAFGERDPTMRCRSLASEGDAVRPLVTWDSRCYLQRETTFERRVGRSLADRTDAA